MDPAKTAAVMQGFQQEMEKMDMGQEMSELEIVVVSFQNVFSSVCLYIMTSLLLWPVPIHSVHAPTTTTTTTTHYIPLLYSVLHLVFSLFILHISSGFFVLPLSG